MKSGTVTTKNLSELKEWYLGLSFEAAKALCEKYAEPFGRTSHQTPEKNALSKAFSLQYYDNYTVNERWEERKKEILKAYSKFFSYAKEFEQPIRVGYWDDNFAYLYVGNKEEGIVIPEPEKYLDFTPDKDYSDMTPAEVRALYGGIQGEQKFLATAKESLLSPKQAQAQLETHQTEIEQTKEMLEQVRRAETEELAVLKEEIRKKEYELQQKKEALTAQLNEKLEQLENTKEQLEGQIFLLESQIYSIRCFAGEVIQFTQIRSGKKAPDTEPIVIHQKLRFLDEDLARLTSLYQIDWGEIELFEEFLKYSPLALDTFAPNDRCVVLVRLSKTGTILRRRDDVTWANLLESVEYYHGKTVGIIIRNGENLYLGWTDEDHIDISDDLIISQTITTIEPAEEPKFHFESDRKNWIKKQRQERKRLLEGIVSRTFVYNILEGVVEHSSILPLPKGVTLAKQSEYVQYAVADKWLADNRFGSFTKIMEKVNAQIQRGDKILTTQYLVPEYDRGFGSRSYYGQRPYENPRGRGEKNRTHDCSVENCKIYSVNLVEYDDPVSITRFRTRYEPSPNAQNPQPYWRERVISTESYERNFQNQETNEVLEVYDHRERHVFVSVPKTLWWKGTDSRANFELYEGEYLNLTFLNTVWLEWVITNKSLGDWNIGGKPVIYAHGIRYLKVAMDHVREREEEEKKLIEALDPNVTADPDWPVKLSEWKLEHQVHKITEYQAKRFVKAINKSVIPTAKTGSL